MHPRTLNISHGDGLGITTIVINTVFLALATVAVGIRLWARKIQRHSLVLNDYAAMLALVFSTSLIIASFYAIVHHGADKHTASLKPADLVKNFKSYIAINAVWAAANTSVKISIVHFYITIFRSNKTFLILAYAVMGFVLAFGVGVVISDFIFCRPFSKASDRKVQGLCENSSQVLIGISSVNMASDLIIILLPMPVVWRLQMAARRKIEVTLVFALGFIVCVVTIIRLVLTTQINLDDYTYDIAKAIIVSLLEPLLGIIVACLPLFPAAVKKVATHIRKTDPETPNVLSSSMARLRLKRAKGSAFQSLSDSFSLTDLDVRGTQNHVTGPSGKPDDIFEGYGKLAGLRIPPQSSIMVERDLEVRSDDAKHFQGKLEV